MSEKSQTIWVEQLVLVQDPILGSKYELQMVEVVESEFFQHLGIDATTELEKILTEEIKKATKKAPKNEQ